MQKIFFVRLPRSTQAQAVYSTILPRIGGHAPLSGIIEFSNFSKSNFKHLAAHAPLSKSPCALKWIALRFYMRAFSMDIEFIGGFQFHFFKFSKPSQFNIKRVTHQFLWISSLPDLFILSLWTRFTTTLNVSQIKQKYERLNLWRLLLALEHCNSENLWI